MASNFQNKSGDDLAWIATIAYILTTDSVLGDPANISDGSTFTGKINQVLQNVIDNLNYLRDAIAIASEAEARAGTDNEKIMTAARIVDALQNGSSYAASESQKGVVERATQAELVAGADDERYISPLQITNFLKSIATLQTGNIFENGISYLYNNHPIRDATWIPGLNELWQVMGSNTSALIRRWTINNTTGQPTANGTIALPRRDPSNIGWSPASPIWIPGLNELWVENALESPLKIYRYTINMTTGAVSANGENTTTISHNGSYDNILFIEGLNELWIQTNNQTIHRFTINMTTGAITANGTRTLTHSSSPSQNIRGVFVYIPTIKELWSMPRNTGQTFVRYTTQRYLVDTTAGTITDNGTHSFDVNLFSHFVWIPGLKEIWLFTRDFTLNQYQYNRFRVAEAAQYAFKEFFTLGT